MGCDLMGAAETLDREKPAHEVTVNAYNTGETLLPTKNYNCCAYYEPSLLITRAFLNGVF